MTDPQPDDAQRDPSVSEVIGAALGGAARKAGIDPSEQVGTQTVVWSAIGGWRGILESILPSLAFVVLFTLKPEPLALALGVSVGLAAIFTAIRLIQKSPPAAAIGGLVAAAGAAALALFTGKAENNFVLGFFTNAGYGTAFLISALIGWSLIGVAAGFLMGEGTAWRGDRRKRRAFFWLAIGWAALFYARLAVQVPLYFAGEVATLGTFKLVMGLPLFAPMLAVTWLVVRALYPGESPQRSASDA